MSRHISCPAPRHHVRPDLCAFGIVPMMDVRLGVELVLNGPDIAKRVQVDDNGCARVPATKASAVAIPEGSHTHTEDKLPILRRLQRIFRAPLLAPSAVTYLLPRFLVSAARLAPTLRLRRAHSAFAALWVEKQFRSSALRSQSLE